MDQAWIILGPVLGVFGVVGVGAVLRRLEWLTEEADRTLLKLVVNVFVPCLIFMTIVGNESLRDARNVWLPPLIGFGTTLLGYGSGLLAAHLLRRWRGFRQPVERRTFAVCIGVYNYGYLPLPLVYALFDTATAGVLFVHNIGVEIAMWTVGLALVSGRMGGDWWRQLLNAPTIAIVLALVLNAVAPARLLPAVVTDAVVSGVGMLGVCAIPVALLLIGAIVADFAREMNPWRGHAAITVGWVLRLGLLPLAFLAIAWAVPMSVELARVIAIQAAMPCAVFPIVLSRHYGGDPPTALRVVLGTSLLSLVTIPFWIMAGMQLLDLTPLRLAVVP